MIQDMEAICDKFSDCEFVKEYIQNKKVPLVYKIL